MPKSEMRFSEETLEKWLDTHERDVAIAIAARAAMRVLPLLGTIDYPKQQEAVRLLAFTCFRALYTAEAAVIAPSTATYAASRDAAHADISFAENTPLAVAKLALTAAQVIHNPTFAACATFVSILGADLAEHFAAFDPFCGALNADMALIDAGRSASEMLTTKLWHDTEPPNSLVSHWQGLFQYLKSDRTDWSYWLDWALKSTDGIPRSKTEMDSLLAMSCEDWDKGPDFVNSIVIGLVAPEEVYADVKTPSDPAILTVTLERVSDALSDTLGERDLTDQALEVVIINRLLDKYRSDAQRVEMDLMMVARSLKRQISSGELAPANSLQFLAEICETGALDLRAGNPELAKSREIRERHAKTERTVVKLDAAQRVETGPMVAMRNDTKVPMPEGAGLTKVVAEKLLPAEPRSPSIGGLFDRLSRSLLQRQSEVLQD